MLGPGWLADRLSSLLDVVRTSTEQHLRQCKDHADKCARQLALDGLVIIASYALLLYLLEGEVVPWRRAATFYALFVALAFVFRWLDLGLYEQLTRVAGFQIGTKLFAALTG
jgi:hypothetical protein